MKKVLFFVLEIICCISVYAQTDDPVDKVVFETVPVPDYSAYILTPKAPAQKPLLSRSS